MDLFENMCWIEGADEVKEDDNILHTIHENNNHGALLSKQVYWTHDQPWDVETDSDFDGIPDALDYKMGPGQYEG